MERDAALCMAALHNPGWLRVSGAGMVDLVDGGGGGGGGRRVVDLHGLHASPAVALLREVVLPAWGGSGDLEVVTGVGHGAGAPMRAAVTAYLAGSRWRIADRRAGSVVLAGR
jgi:hypothetical protein